jgi:signal transduction histidine kinase
MQIRTKLTLQFFIIGGVIMIIASAAIYFSSASFRREDFYNRLENKANNTAKLLIDVEEIDATLLKKIETDNPINLPEEKIIILDYKNDTLFSTDDNGEIIIDKKLNDRIRLEGNVRYRQEPFEVLGLLYTGQYDRFVVVAAAVDIYGLLKLKNLKIVLLVVCLISLILFTVAGWIFAGNALQPISGVVRQVEEISISSLNLRVAEGNGTDEIAKLGKTFNKMLERLEDAFKLQKDFISNASHELRTPLTSINGELEVLLLKKRSPKEYNSAILSALEDIRNLTDLSNRLLLLAQTTSEKLSINHKLFRIDDTLLQVKSEFQRFKKEYNINILIGDTFTDSEQLIISGDEYLLKTAIYNIIENACKYSDDQSVKICLDKSSGWISISFIDNGIGIDKKEIEKVFEPFHRGNNVLNIPGHGIGLSLANRIIKNHFGTITISSKINEGTLVLIKLPSIS